MCVSAFIKFFNVIISYFFFTFIDVNVAELNGAPGPLESTVTIRGRQCAKLSGEP